MKIRGLRYYINKRKIKFFAQKNLIISKIITKLLKLNYRRLQIKFGIEIPVGTEIAEGALINHFGGIVINENTKIGKNVTILQGVTIGNNMYKGRLKAAKIGDNVTIGANTVVTKSFPDNCVIAGNPAKIISYKESIVLNTDYMLFDDYCKTIEE